LIYIYIYYYYYSLLISAGILSSVQMQREGEEKNETIHAIMRAVWYVCSILTATNCVIVDFSWSMADVEHEQCRILKTLMERMPRGVFYQFHHKFSRLTDIAEVGRDTPFGFGLTNLCKPLDMMIDVLRSNTNVVAFTFLTDGDDTVSNSSALVAKQTQFFNACLEFLSRKGATLSFALVARGFCANRTIYAIVACLKLLHVLELFLSSGGSLTSEHQFVVTDAVECTLPGDHAVFLLPSGNILELLRVLKDKLARLSPDLQERILSTALSFCKDVPIVEDKCHERKAQTLQLNDAIRRLVRPEIEAPVVLPSGSSFRKKIIAMLLNQPPPRQQPTTRNQYQPYVSNDQLEAELASIVDPDHKSLDGSRQELACKLFTKGSVWFMSDGQLCEAKGVLPLGVFPIYKFVSGFRNCSQAARNVVVSALYPVKPSNKEVTEQLMRMLTNPTTSPADVMVFLEWWSSLADINYYFDSSAWAVREDTQTIQGTKQRFTDGNRLYDLLQMVAICLFPLNGYAVRPNDWYAFLLAFSRFTVDLDLKNGTAPMWNGDFLLATSVDPIKLMRAILEINRHQVGNHLAKLLDIHLDKTCGADDIKRARMMFAWLKINTQRDLSLFLLKILKGFKRKTRENPERIQGFVKVLMDAVFFVPMKAAKNLRDIILELGTHVQPQGVVDIPTLYVTPTLLAAFVAPPMTPGGWGDEKAKALILGEIPKHNRLRRKEPNEDPVETPKYMETLGGAIDVAIKNNSTKQSDTFPLCKNQSDDTLQRIFECKASEKTSDAFRGYFVITGDYILWYIVPRTMDPHVIKFVQSPTWKCLLPMAYVARLIAACTPSGQSRLDDNELWRRVRSFDCFSQLFASWKGGANWNERDEMPPMSVVEGTNAQIGNIVKFCMWLRSNM
jgi:hypothetical protein